MKLTEVVENEDGSLDCVLAELTKDEVEMLIRRGLLDLLREAIEEDERKHKTAALLRPKEGE